ncbi:MAG: SMC-Scp complex subunit ScpB [archaeon]|nr:SMC-Scp complex subunit ScpB [archaeon]
MNIKSAVEAALFSSSKSVCLVDIATKINAPTKEVRHAIKDLIADYEERDSAITIVKIGSGYRMKLRDEYTDFAGKFAKLEMTKSMMKTAATIAYNQPVMQANLYKNLGSRVYDDVRALIDLKLISGKSSGQTLELTTTKKFSEYFGINSTKKEAIRKWIEENERKNYADQG